MFLSLKIYRNLSGAWIKIVFKLTCRTLRYYERRIFNSYDGDYVFCWGTYLLNNRLLRNYRRLSTDNYQTNHGNNVC